MLPRPSPTSAQALRRGPSEMRGPALLDRAGPSVAELAATLEPAGAPYVTSSPTELVLGVSGGCPNPADRPGDR